MGCTLEAVAAPLRRFGKGNGAPPFVFDLKERLRPKIGHTVPRSKALRPTDFKIREDGGAAQSGVGEAGEGVGGIALGRQPDVFTGDHQAVVAFLTEPFPPDGARAAEGGSGCHCVPEVEAIDPGGFHDPAGWSGEAQSRAGEAGCKRRDNLENRS
jgi:hypothetical protein